MSQSSAPYLILAIRRATNRKMTETQATVKQITLTAIISGTLLSDACFICHSISEGDGMVAILPGDH